MQSKPAATVTDADVRSLAAKLKGLHALLTPGEQALLHSLMRRAADRDRRSAPDAEGFAWAVSFNPFTYLDAIAGEIERGDRRTAPEPCPGIGERGRESSDQTRRRGAAKRKKGAER